jgi:hypothetical protein
LDCSLFIRRIAVKQYKLLVFRKKITLKHVNLFKQIEKVVQIY